MYWTKQCTAKHIVLLSHGPISYGMGALMGIQKAAGTV